MKRTTQEIKMNFRGYDVIIPKGTAITNQTACGVDPKYNFISDLSWIPKVEVNGKEYKNFGLIHDATYYGIDIPAEMVEETKD